MSRFVECQSAEHAQFGDAAFARVERCQFRQRAIDVKQEHGPRLAKREALVEDAVHEAIDQVLEVPLAFPETALVSSKDVVGLQFYVSAKPEFRGTGIAAG